MIKRNRKKRLSLRIAMITFVSAMFSIAGILILSVSLRQVEENYARLMEEDYINVSYMHTLNRKMQQHQAVVISYLIEESPQARDGLLERADKLEAEMYGVLTPFGENLKGGKYERFYHDIYSGLVGYFNNTQVAFGFRDKGAMATAFHFTRSSLQENIKRVNDNMDLLSLVLEGDMEYARSLMEDRMLFCRVLSVVFLVLVVTASLTSIFLCTKISEEATGTDLLTGVSNFDGLTRFGEKLKKNGKLQHYTGVAASIRNFKYINQEYGSKTGDVVLKQYAAKLASFINKGELVARNSGDNFLILVHKSGVREFIAKLNEMEVELPDGNGPLQLVTRCGFYDAKEEDSISNVVDACNLALNDARKRGDVDQVWFESGMYGKLLERKEILSRYRKGLEKEEFKLYFQPKVDMNTNTLCGAEALVRWFRDGKVVPPMEFIPVLEEEGSIVTLDFYVFETLCRSIRGWLDEGLEPVRVSSNFSKLHLRNANFAERIINIMERYSIDGKYVEVELTESSGYEDFDALKAFVARMRERGVGMSIDDFGTGYSSLSLLKDLDADVVKLDRSFLFGLEKGDPFTARLIANVVRMIQDLDRKVICEGVETKEHVEFLLGVGCNTAQGFYYDKPLMQVDFEQRLKQPKYEDK